MQKQSNRIFKLILRSISFVVSLFIYLDASAQDANLDLVRKQFIEYNQNAPQEKLFLHTDKDFYVAGEIIWFKVYSINAASNRPVNLSKVAYIEILDRDQRSVLKAKISIKEGNGNGSLYLPVTLNSGNFRIRAYTNWMQNFDPAYYFEKNIIIVNSLKNPDEQPQEKAMAYDVQFFPEGGNLVEGVPGKIAFRVIGQNGKGVDFKGALINANKDTLARFQPVKFGIGSFSFTPAANNTYQAVINIPGAKAIIIKELPAVYKTGYVMRAFDSDPEKIRVSVQSNMPSKSAIVYLFIHTRQEIKIVEAAALNDGKAEFVIDKSKMGNGISHITVFNSSKQPVCERLYFKRPPQELKIEAEAGQKQYALRKQVTVTMLAKDENGKEQAADLSMSVFPSTALDSAGVDIFSYLWLSSDLKGNIESPGYYFKSDNPETNEALDNLMLTHGWRRFVWEDVLQNKTPFFKFLPEFEGHIITGKIINNITGAAAENIMTYLSVPGTKLQLYGSRSNGTGDIKFYTKDLYGPGNIVAQTDFQRDSTYHIDISSPFSDKFSAEGAPEFDLTENFREQLLKQNISAQVQNVYAGNKLKIFYPPVIDSSAFYLKPDKQYLLDNYTRFKTMEEVIREYVIEANLTRQRKDFHLAVLVKPYYNLPYSVTEPLILLDGVPIFDRGNKIIAYDPMKVNKLEIVTQKYFLGPLIFNSIINFTTYKGNLPEFKLDPRATVMDYEGMQLNREFYSPIYQTENQISSRIPDFRNVLYWSPDIKIDASGKKTISFYTSDQENRYTVLIQGLNTSGRAGITMFNIDVRK